VLLTVSQIFLFSQYEYIAKLIETQIEKRISEEQNRYYERQLKIVKESLENYKMIRHDLKNQMVPLHHLAVTEQKEKLIAMIEQLTEGYGIHKEYVSSGNDAIDSIINFKLHSAESMGVKVTTKILIPSDLSLPTLHITTVLGNMLDNALEALEYSENKWLEIAVKYEKGHLTIRVCNSYDGTVNKSEGQILSRKRENKTHGIGLNSILAIAKKYKGDMYLTYDEMSFETKVIMLL
jgi:sensor histidine kinase regulating citrate/malate metabolism